MKTYDVAAAIVGIVFLFAWLTNTHF